MSEAAQVTTHNRFCPSKWVRQTTRVGTRKTHDRFRLLGRVGKTEGPFRVVLLTLELVQRGAFGQDPTDCAFARPLRLSLPEGPKRKTLPLRPTVSPSTMAEIWTQQVSNAAQVSTHNTFCPREWERQTRVRTRKTDGQFRVLRHLRTSEKDILGCPSYPRARPEGGVWPSLYGLRLCRTSLPLLAWRAETENPSPSTDRLAKHNGRNLNSTGVQRSPGFNPQHVLP